MHGRGEEQQPRDETPPDNRGAEHDPKGAHGEKLARSQLRTIGRKYEPRSARRRLRPRGRGPSRATACTAAGFSGIVPHDLRRSAARNAVRSGVPEQVAMELGGWRTRSVFARYNVTSESDLADAVERVSRYVTERAAERPKVEPLPVRRAEMA